MLLLALIEDIRSEVTQESWPSLQSRSSPYDKGVNRQRLATCMRLGYTCGGIFHHA